MNIREPKESGMKEAIKKALEGGLRDTHWDETLGEAYFSDGDGGYYVSNEKLLLSKEFWQCLGKALGKDTTTAYCPLCKIDRDFQGKKLFRQWEYMWFSFIDHLAEGKDVDEFFSQIIPDNKK